MPNEHLDFKPNRLTNVGRRDSSNGVKCQILFFSGRQANRPLLEASRRPRVPLSAALRRSEDSRLLGANLHSAPVPRSAGWAREAAPLPADSAPLLLSAPPPLDRE